MKIIVCVVVYDRIDNVKRWIDCWSKCEKYGAELFIIHNIDNVTGLQTNPISELLSNSHDINYRRRLNVGYDIGAFQDVCRDRLHGIPHDWEAMLWCTDDFLPMRRDFIKTYSHFIERYGVVATEISNEVRTHIRTSGFMIRKDVCRLLEFPADPISTKDHCWNFEHRDKRNTFLFQIQRMGHKAIQPIKSKQQSAIWDSGQKKKFDRWKEFEDVWALSEKPEIELSEDVYVPVIYENTFKYECRLIQDDTPLKPQVLIICPVYKRSPITIVASMLMQTYQNWKLHLIHDGPACNSFWDEINYFCEDPRISILETPDHVGNWGHSIRSNEIKDVHLKADYVVITNADNYHAPTYLESMLSGFKPGIVATYCSQMVHSYRKWDAQDCKLQRGYIDCAGVMIKAEVAADVGWKNTTDHSADWFFFADIIKKHGIRSFAKVRGALLVHN